MHSSSLRRALADTIVDDRRGQAAKPRLVRPLRPLAVVTAVAALRGFVTSPAHAANGAAKPKLLPVVVDGKHYTPAQMRRFEGRGLYSRISDDGRTLVGYTKLRAYKRFLASRGLVLPADPQATRNVAHAAVHGARRRHDRCGGAAANGARARRGDRAADQRRACRRDRRRRARAAAQ